MISLFTSVCGRPAGSTDVDSGNYMNLLHTRLMLFETQYTKLALLRTPFWHVIGGFLSLQIIAKVLLWNVRYMIVQKTLFHQKIKLHFRTTLDPLPNYWVSI